MPGQASMPRAWASLGMPKTVVAQAHDPVKAAQKAPREGGPLSLKQRRVTASMPGALGALVGLVGLI